MPIPILKQGQVLVVCMHAAMTDHDLVQLQDNLAKQIGASRSRGVVIDVSALDVLDSFASRTLRGIAQTTWLRGARTIVVGIQPEVAFAMVQLGLLMEGVETALDLEEGIELVAARMEERCSHD